jgi:hypothetical protein
VHDNEYHQYANLAAYLDGGGVPDIEETMKEIFLQPIHTAFSSNFSATFLSMPLLHLFLSVRNPMDQPRVCRPFKDAFGFFPGDPPAFEIRYAVTETTSKSQIVGRNQDGHAVPSESVEQVAQAIGAALADEFGKKVLLVDANLSAPNLGLHLGNVKPEATLFDVIIDKIGIRKAIAKHDSGFDYIPGSLAYHKIDKDIYQLKKKIDAGAKLLLPRWVTNARKFHEVLQWLRISGCSIPALANIYILPYGAAKLMKREE